MISAPTNTAQTTPAAGKILIIRLGAMGDLIHAACGVAALKANWPEAEVHWLTSPAFQPLVEAFSGGDSNTTRLVAKSWGYDKASGLSGLFPLANQLRQERYDLIVNLHPSLKTRLLAWLARPRAAVAYRKEKLAVQGQAQRAVTRRHAIDDFYRPLQAHFNLSPARLLPLQTEAPKVVSGTPDHRERAIGLIVGVGGKRGNRAWPLAHFAQLIRDLLAQTDHPLWLMGGADEAPLAEALLAEFAGEPRLVDYCGRQGILESAALLNRCQVVVGGDTGPLHLASATHAQVIGLFGPTSIARTGPVGHFPRVETLLPPDSVDCWPCELAACPLAGDRHLACVQQITPQAVLEACLKRL